MEEIMAKEKFSIAKLQKQMGRKYDWSWKFGIMEGQWYCYTKYNTTIDDGSVHLAY